MRAELLGFVVVEGVFGVDHAVGDPIEGLPDLLVVVAPPVLAQDLEELVEAEAHHPIGREAACPMDQLHDRDVDVPVHRTGYPVLTPTDNLDVLLQALAVGRAYHVGGLQALF